MIGMAKMTFAGGAPVAQFGCFITPDPFANLVPNGAYTTPFFTGNVTGGVGPFEYQWSVTPTGFSVLTPTGERTRVSVSGYNDEAVGTLTLTVTDTSNNQEVTTTAMISIFFGTPQ